MNIQSLSTLLAYMERGLKIEQTDAGSIRAIYPRDTFSASDIELIEDAARSVCLTGRSANQDMPHLQQSVEVNRYANQYLWAYDNLKSQSATYNVPIFKRIKGEFDPGRFLFALSRLVNHHPVLHSVYAIDGERITLNLRQKSIGLFEDALVDLSSLSLERRQEILDEHALQCSSRPFDLSYEFPVRCTVFHLGSLEHQLHLTFHHCAMDGWAVGLFFDELSELYNDPGYLPQTNTLYLNYIRAPFSFVANPEQSLDFWRNELRDCPVRHGLSYDQIEVNEPRALNVFTQDLDPELLKCLTDRASHASMSLFILLQSAFAFLISRLSGQAQVVIGCPVANRPDARLNEAIGSFVNTIALHYWIDETSPFIELMDITRQKLFRSHEHHGLPFTYIVDTLKPPRGDYNPFYQILFVYQQQTAPHYFGEAALESVQRLYSSPKSDLALEVIARKEGVRLEWQFNPHLFKMSTIQAYAQRYLNLLQQVAIDLNRTLGSLRLIDKETRNRLLLLSEGVQADKYKGHTLNSLMASAFNEFGDRIAVIDDAAQYSYNELLTAASSVASYIDSRVPSGACVAVQLMRGYRQVVTILAIVLSGRPYLPLPHDAPLTRVGNILSAAGSCWLVVEERVVKLPTEVVPLPIEDAIHYKSRVGWKIANCTCQSLAYLIYTSGTTGIPKGVAIEHGAVCNTLMAMNELFQVDHRDRALALSNLSFDLSVFDLFGMWIAGGCVTLLDERMTREPSWWVDYIERDGISIWNSVPALLDMIICHMRETRHPPLLSVRQIWLSGDWIPPKLIEQARCHFPAARIVSLGGATEGSIWSIYHLIDPNISYLDRIPYGKALPNQNMYVLDEQSELSDIGEAGHIHIGGHSVARCYHNDEVQTAASFFWHQELGERLYRTGDRGRWHPDGYIEFLGRADKQVKVQGFRIELGEIEAVLKASPLVIDAAVVAHQDGVGSAVSLHAHVVLTKKATHDWQQAVHLFAKGLLNSYMLPHRYARHEQFPLTTNGKVDLSRLPFIPAAVQSVERSLPVSAEVVILAEMIAEILASDVHKLDMSSSFYAAGGSSLQAISLAVRLKESLGVEASVADILDAPNLFSLLELRKNEKPRALSQITIERHIDAVATIYLIHAGTGHVGHYRPLVEKLRGDVNIVTLSSPALSGIDDDDEISFAELLEAHLLKLVETPLPGPSLIIGWSMGGVLALNIVDRLHKDGIAIDQVMVIDAGLCDGEHRDRSSETTWVEVANNVCQSVGISKPLTVGSLPSCIGFEAALQHFYQQNQKTLQARLSLTQFLQAARSLERSRCLLMEASIPAVSAKLDVWLSRRQHGQDDVQAQWIRKSPHATLSWVAANHYEILQHPDIYDAAHKALENFRLQPITGQRV